MKRSLLGYLRSFFSALLVCLTFSSLAAAVPTDNTPGISYLRWSPSGKYLLVSLGPTRDKQAVVDTESSATVWQSTIPTTASFCWEPWAPVGPERLALITEQKSADKTKTQWRLLILDPNGKEITSYPLATGPGSYCWNSDASQLAFFDANGSGNLLFLQADTQPMKLNNTLLLPPDIKKESLHKLRWQPNRNLIAAERGDGRDENLTLINIDSGDVRPLLYRNVPLRGIQLNSAVWNTEGNRLLFAAGNTSFYSLLLQRESQPFKTVTCEGFRFNAESWSANRQKVAFLAIGKRTRLKNARADAYVYSLRPEHIKQLTRCADVTQVALSPSGQTAAVVHNDIKLNLINVATGKEKPIWQAPQP